MAQRPSRTSSHPQPRHLLSRLQREWVHLRERAELVAQAAAWQLPGGAAAGRASSLDDVLVLAGMELPHRTAVPAEAGDLALRRLVELARTDDLAARCVLQRLLPGLSAAARRRGRRFGDHLDAFDELLSAAWRAIREFPAARPAAHVAAALLRDAEYHAFRRGRRSRLVHELTPPDQLDRPVEHEPDEEPLAELMRVVGEASKAHLPAADRSLLGCLLSSGTAADAAARLEVTPRTLRNHRDALVHRLRVAAAA